MKLIKIAITLFCLTLPFAINNPTKADESLEIAPIQSRLILSGIVYATQENDITNSAILNDTICWEGRGYTIIDDVIMVRTLTEERDGAPKLTVLKVGYFGPTIGRGVMIRFEGSPDSDVEEFIIQMRRN